MPIDHLKSLTSLRFFAAMWVVLFDYWPKLAVGFHPGWIQKGFLGVEVFFILSGFILCHVYLPSAEEKKFRYRSFLWARIARVYPLHLATLAGIGLLAAGALAVGVQVGGNILAWDALPANLLMIHAWGLAKTAGWNHPSWSISAEWFAYLTFPVFALLTVRMRNRPLAALCGAVAVLFAIYIAFEAVAGFPLTKATIAWGALRIVPCFLLGCALYLVWRAGFIRSRAVALIGAAASAAALLVGAEFNVPEGLVVASGGFLILFLAACASTGSSLLTGKVSVYLGEISYAVYMVCIPWMLVYVNGMEKLLGLEPDRLPLPVWLGLVAGVVVTAAIAHHLVERPARAALRGWGRLWPARPLAALTA